MLPDPTRDRLSIDPVPISVATLAAEDRHGEEFILDPAAKEYGFKHWQAHMFSFFGWYSEPDYHVKADEFPKLKMVIAAGLSQTKFFELAPSILAAKTEEDLNRTLIEQYTTGEPRNFYKDVNWYLRGAHTTNAPLRGPLVPWILQFNAMLRMRGEHHDVAYRGALLTSDEIDAYKIDEFYVWAPFVSASKTESACFKSETNVLFELVPFGAVSHYGKRDGRDISSCSLFPQEEEVIFPMCCAYRLKKKILSNGVTRMTVEVVDSY